MKRIVFLLYALASALCIIAVPARREGQVITLQDGTQAIRQLHGDEFYHWTTISTMDGQEVTSTLNSTTQQRAASRRDAVNQRRTQRRRLGEFGNMTGTKRAIVILVNFSDRAFASSQSQWNNQFNQSGYSANGHIGSVADYFRDQSYGRFNLEFDVVGPVTVSRNMSYYGGNDSDGNDLHPAEMVTEAVRLANTQYDIDFSQYDWDGDNYVDQVFVIYAGYAESNGAPASTIWPHEWVLSSAAYFGDGNGEIRVDGVTIDTYACSSELTYTSGTEMAAIGTACHEFSHCLGYPDLYDTSSQGSFGMDGHDIMDYGSYGGDHDGNIPSGYTAYERWMAGWLTPVELHSDTVITAMPALNDTAVAYILYNDNNHNEYFLLENRQARGWFRHCGGADIAGHGILITHCDYNASVWENNEVNNTSSHQRFTIVPADKRYSHNNLQGDLFPYQATNEFTNTSHYNYGGKLFNRNSDGSYYLNKPITSITESNGLISFVCMNGSSGTPTDPTEPSDPSGALRFVPVSDASMTQSGVTVAFDKGVGLSAPAWNDNSNHLRLYASNTISVSASSNITKIEVQCSKQGNKAYATLSANCGNLVSGGNSTSNDDIKTDTWTGNARQVVFTLGNSGQRVINRITVYVGSDPTDPDDPVTPPTDPDDPVTPPTDPDDPVTPPSDPTETSVVITNTENVGSNRSYSFDQSGITVSCTTGARTETYFSCNAGNQITFSATRAIKSIAINGFVKQYFDATTDHGSLTHVDASSEEQTADPVVVVRDINATSVTISCVKQMRCYAATIYFDENADPIVNDGHGGNPTGDYNYDFEPHMASTITTSFSGTEGEVDDSYVSEYSYIELFLDNGDYYADIVFMADHCDNYTVIPAGTYAINDTYQLGTVNSSVGGDDEEDYPSFLATDFDSQGYYNKSYYFISGQVVVSRVNGVGTRVEVTATTYYGSTLHLSYQGNLTQGSLPTSVESVVEETVPTKYLEDGQLIIRHNGQRYSILGQKR